MASPSRREPTGLALVAATAAMIGGCSDDRLSFSWPPSAELAFTVVAPEDWRGTVGELEIEGPMVVASVPKVLLEISPEARLYVLTVDASVVRSSNPRAETPERWSLAARSNELETNASCLANGWLHDLHTLELPLGAETAGVTIFEARAETSTLVPVEPTALITKLSLLLPLRPCFEGRQLRLRPFADGTADAAELRMYQRVEHLEADTIIAVSDDLVAVIGRRETRERWRELPLSRFGLPVPPEGEIWRIADAALFGDGLAARGVVSVSRAPEMEGPAEEGRIFEIELDSTGLRLGRERWRNSTPTRTNPRKVADVAFDDRGAWVGVGDGLVLSATAAGAAPAELEQAVAFDGLFVSHAGDEGRDFVLAGRSFVRWFDPSRGRDGLQEVPIELTTGPTRLIDDLRVRAGPNGASLQLLLFPPQIARRSVGSGVWSFRPLATDAAGPRCAQESICGRRYASQRCEFVESWPAMPEHTSFVAPFQCGEIYLVDEQAACSISASIGSGPDLGQGFDEQKILDADQFGDHLTLVGERGRIFEVTVD